MSKQEEKKFIWPGECWLVVHGEIVGEGGKQWWWMLIVCTTFFWCIAGKNGFGF